MKRFIVTIKLLILISLCCNGQTFMKYTSDISILQTIQDPSAVKRYIDKFATSFTINNIIYIFEQEPKMNYDDNRIKTINLYVYKYINNDWKLANPNILFTSVDDGHEYIDFKDPTSARNGNAKIFYLKENMVLITFDYTERVALRFYQYPIFILFYTLNKNTTNLNYIIFVPQREENRMAVDLIENGDDYIIKMSDGKDINFNINKNKISMTDGIRKSFQECVLR